MIAKGNQIDIVKHMTKKVYINLEVTVHDDVSLNAVKERAVDALSCMHITDIEVGEVEE